MADSDERNERELITKLYLSIGEAERKLGESQNTYRTIASSWMLATMGAIGWVLSTGAFNEGFSKYLICTLLALAGAVSIVVIWLLDMRVYQRLLARYYAEGRAMELGEPWLPLVREQTRRYFKGRLPLIISTYYVVLFVFLWGVACFFLALSKEIEKGWAIASAMLGVGGAALILWIERPKSNTGESPSKWPDPIPDEKREEHYRCRREKREASAKQTIATDRASS